MAGQRTANAKASGLYILHMGVSERRLGKVWALPWQKGLKEMGF